MTKPVLGKCVGTDWFFLGRILQYGPFPWKWSQPCIFVLEQSRQIQTLQPKQPEKKMWILSFFIAKLPEKAKKDWNFTEISKMDEEDEHSPSKVSIILNIWKLLVQKLKQASPRARRPKTILSTNRKVQTQTRRRLLIWTLFSTTLKLMVWEMRKLKG